jgi:hypothetical protein
MAPAALQQQASHSIPTEEEAVVGACPKISEKQIVLPLPGIERGLPVVKLKKNII